MTEFQFSDLLALDRESLRVRESDGALLASARAARSGIQVYSGAEVGRPQTDRVRVYRPEDEVFNDASMQSWGFRPITNDHPPEFVDARNSRKYSRGTTGGSVARDGDRIRVDMMVTDAETIDAIQGGKRELSAGYSASLDFTSGTTQDGEAYDAVQRGIRINHLAVVDRARAGPSCRIGDDAANEGTGNRSEQQEKDEAMPDSTVTAVVDGLPVETTEAGRIALDKLVKERDEARAEARKAKDEADKAIAAKDKELGEKDAELKKAKDAMPDAAALDGLARERAEVIVAAKALDASVKTDGVSNADIRAAVVASKMGDEYVKDRSEDYVSGLFASLAKDADKADPVADAFKGATSGSTATKDAVKDRDDAYQGYLDSLNGKNEKEDK